MARAALAIQACSVSSPILQATFTAPNGAGAGNGNTINTQRAKNVDLLVNNIAGGGTRTVTIPNTATNKEQGVTQPSQTFAIPQGKLGVIHLGGDDYADANGNIAADIDSLDSGNVTWAAVQTALNFQ